MSTAPKSRHLFPGESDFDLNFKNDAVRIEPGKYLAYCKRGWLYVDPGYGKWTLLLWWDVLAEDGETIAENVCHWFNLGPASEAPMLTRRCNYVVAWVNAAGHPPARVRMVNMTPTVFLHRIARVRIVDTKSAIPYSRVETILSWETGQSSNKLNSPDPSNNPNKANLPNELGIEIGPSWRAAYKKLTEAKRQTNHLRFENAKRKRLQRERASTRAGVEGN